MQDEIDSLKEKVSELESEVEELKEKIRGAYQTAKDAKSYIDDVLNDLK